MDDRAFELHESELRRGFWRDSLLSGELAAPADDVADPFIDADDIVDVAVAALTGDAPSGRVYEVTGPRLLTFEEAVAEVAEATGKEIRYVPISSEEFKTGMIEAGVPEDFARDLTSLFEEVLDGRSSYLSDGVKRALGREPKDFRDYAREAAATGICNAPAIASPQ